MSQPDIIVVGAGIAGASAAFELAASAKVTLLERESQPGYHSTGRSAAVFAPAYGNRVIRLLTAASEAFYEARLDGLAAGPVLRPRGALLIARPDQLPALTAMQAELRPQLPTLAWLDPAEILARVPTLRPSYAAAALADETARDLDVATIHQAYLTGLRRRGGRLVVDAEVRHLSCADGIWSLDTAAGRFVAPVVVNAAGAWADQLAVLAGVAPVGLVPKRRTAFLFDPGWPVDPAWPAVVDVDEQFYFKPESGLLLGSPADETPLPPCDVQPDELDVALAIDRIEQALTSQVRRVPHRWAGLRSFVADRTPVLGPSERAGFHWLAGQGGYGIQTAPAMGRAAAAVITTGALPAELCALGLSAADLAADRPGLGERRPGQARPG